MLHLESALDADRKAFSKPGSLMHLLGLIAFRQFLIRCQTKVVESKKKVVVFFKKIICSVSSAFNPLLNIL